MTTGRFTGGLFDYYKYALIRHLIGVTSDDAAAQLRCALLNLSRPPESNERRWWKGGHMLPERGRALDPELAAALDKIEDADFSFGKLVEMGLFPASTTLHWSCPAVWTAKDVTEAIFEGYVQRRDAWFPTARAVIQRDNTAAPIDLLVIEPFEGIQDPFTYQAAKARFDEDWRNNVMAPSDPVTEDDFRLCFFMYHFAEAQFLYWGELAALWADGHSLLVQNAYVFPENFVDTLRVALLRFVDVAPGSVLLDAVKIYYRHGWIIAVQPRHTEALIPRWKSLPQKMGDGCRNWGGLMAFEDQNYWYHKSALAWKKKPEDSATSD